MKDEKYFDTLWKCFKGYRNGILVWNGLAYFFLMFPSDPPENIKKPLRFQGDQKGRLGKNGLIW